MALGWPAGINVGGQSHCVPLPRRDANSMRIFCLRHRVPAARRSFIVSQKYSVASEGRIAEGKECPGCIDFRTHQLIGSRERCSRSECLLSHHVSTSRCGLPPQEDRPARSN